MAISLSSHFFPHCLPHPQIRPKPSRFLCYSSNSSSYSIQSNNSDLSLKPSSKTSSYNQKPSEEAIRLGNLLRKSLLEHNYTESLSVVESMASQGYPLSVKSCAELIGCLSSSGKLDQAAHVISVIESHGQANTVLYNVFITGLCRKNQIIPALETLGRMQANGCRPNIVTHNILVGALCNRGMLDLAFERVEYFKRYYKVPPDVITYTQLLQSTIVEKGVKEGMKLFDEMESQGILPDRTTYSRVVRAMCKAGLADEILEIQHAMPQRFKLNAIDYSALLEALFKKKHFGKVDQVIDEMLGGECEFNNSHLDAMMKMVCKEGLVDKAMALTKWAMKKPWFKPGCLIRAMCKAGHVDGMLAVLDAISARGVKLGFTSYSAMLEALLENKRFGDVDKVIDEMLVKACWMSHFQLGSVVKKLCEKGLVDKARALIEGIMKGRRMKPGYKCCNLVICTFIKAGHLNKAIDFINYLITIGRIPNITFYNPILSGLCNHGQVRYALEMLDKLEKVGCSPDVVTYTVLIGTLWSIGDHVGSVEMVSRLFEKGLSPDRVTYQSLITCLCQDGMIDEAMEVKGIMAENGLTVRKPTYDMLLVGFCKVGRVNEAFDLLDEMFESGCEVNGRSLAFILEGLAYIGYESEARKIAEELVLRKFLSPYLVDLLREKISEMSSSADL